jgi:excisionase family DNA binding protein
VSYLTIRQLALELGVSDWTIWNQIRRGNLRALRIGRVYRIHLADAEGFKGRAVVRPLRPIAVDPPIAGALLIDRVLRRGAC